MRSWGPGRKSLEIVRRDDYIGDLELLLKEWGAEATMNPAGGSPEKE